MEAFTVEADLAGGPHAAARARRLVEHELKGRMSGARIAEACLLITELVANSVRHGGATAGRSMHVLLQGRRPGLHVEVSNADGRPRDRIAPRRPDMLAGGGLGLHVVERLASRWGVRDARPIAVWFELDLDR